MTHPALFQVGMRHSFVYHSQPEDYGPKGWATPKFMPGAFDRQVGKVIPLKLEQRQFGHARAIAAKVAEDGYSVEFTYEITDLDPHGPDEIAREIALEDSNGRWWYSCRQREHGPMARAAPP